MQNLLSFREGPLSFLAPAPKYDKAKNILTTPRVEVFYNPRMEFNRDMAVLVLDSIGRTSQNQLRVCEPFTGCGVRGIRYAQVANIQSVVINDLNPAAAKLAQVNMHDGSFSAQIRVENKDANRLLSENVSPGTRFDFIDIDPYGSPVHFIDPALRALNHDGIIALTATDMAPLCGAHAQACLRRYGAKPLRTEYCHELAVRILAGFVCVTAAKYNLSIEPVFCHAADHYVRVYSRMKKGVSKTESTLRQLGFVNHCFRCFSRTINLSRFQNVQGNCPNCGTKTDFAGPLWLGELWNSHLCETMMYGSMQMTFGQSRRIRRTLEIILRERKGPATFFMLSNICDKIGISIPKLATVLSEVNNAGFLASDTHFHGQGLRTDCPATRLTNLLSGLN